MQKSRSLLKFETIHRQTRPQVTKTPRTNWNTPVNLERRLFHVECSRPSRQRPILCRVCQLPPHRLRWRRRRRHLRRRCTRRTASIISYRSTLAWNRPGIVRQDSPGTATSLALSVDQSVRLALRGCKFPARSLPLGNVTTRDRGGSKLCLSRLVSHFYSSNFFYSSYYYS